MFVSLCLCLVFSRIAHAKFVLVDLVPQRDAQGQVTVFVEYPISMYTLRPGLFRSPNINEIISDPSIIDYRNASIRVVDSDAECPLREGAERVRISRPPFTIEKSPDGDALCLVYDERGSEPQWTRKAQEQFSRDLAWVLWTSVIPNHAKWIRAVRIIIQVPESPGSSYSYQAEDAKRFDDGSVEGFLKTFEERYGVSYTDIESLEPYYNRVVNRKWFIAVDIATISLSLFAIHWFIVRRLKVK